MAFSYGFFDSVEGDRKYTALEMSSIFDGIITDGVLPNYLNEFKVIPGSGLSLIVQSGRAWFDHTWNYNSSNLLLYVNDADRVLTRYDAVVLEVNKARDVRANTIKLVTGMPSTSPTRPQLMNTKEVTQYALAYIQVDPKLTAITSNLIQNMVGTPNTPYATSKLTATDISAVFSQWQGEFEEWYETVKHITSGENIAALQAELAKKLPRADKATTSTPINDNTKYLTPATGLALVDSQVNPIGTIITTEASTKPSGTWIGCNNSNFLQASSYPTLFSDLGHSYGMQSKMLTSAQQEFYWGSYIGDDGEIYYTILMKPADNSAIMSVQNATDDEPAVIDISPEEPFGFNSEGLVKDSKISSRSINYYPLFKRFVVAPKPRATGSSIPFFAQADVTHGTTFSPLGNVFDWSGTLTPNGITVNNYDFTGAQMGHNSFAPAKVWLQDTLVPVNAAEASPYVIAVVDDTNKYTVSVSVNTSTNVGTIYVTVYSGGASNLAPDPNRSYEINVPAPYGGCWVFNNQIYYISNGTIYIVTFGSASPIVYTGSSAQQAIVRYFCECVYNLHYYKKNTGTYNDPILQSGYSFDNKIYAQFYSNDYSPSGSLYVDIVLLKDEYTGEMERHRKRISFMPFQRLSVGSSGSQAFLFDSVKPVIKRNSDGTVTVAFIFAMKYYPLVNSAAWGSASSDQWRFEMYVAAVTGDDIKNDTYNVIYCSNPYVVPTISMPNSSANPGLTFHNLNDAVRGNICETLSDYAVSMFFSQQFTNTQRGPKWLQLVALMLDMRTFAMPWLNNTTSSNVFYIRIS